jgi:hypothetical protein
VLYDGEVCLGGGVIVGSNVQNVAAPVRLASSVMS